METRKRFLSLALALVLCLSLLPTAALAAETAPERGVVTYTEAIAPQYEDAHSFSEDLAAVKKDGKWGYIDTDNQVVVPFQYDQAYNFNEGLAVVSKIVATEEGTQWKQDEETGEGHDVPATWYTVEYGFVDKTGAYTPFMVNLWFHSEGETAPVREFMTDLEFEGEDKVFNNGYIWLCADDGTTAPYILFNTTGREVKNASGYALCTADPMPVNEGLAITFEIGDLEYVLVDVKTGEEVMNSWDILNGTKYEDDGQSHRVSFNCFNQGLAPAFLGTLDEETYEWGDIKMGFIDRQGNWVIQPTLGGGYFMKGLQTTQQIFGDTGLGMVNDTNGKFGAIDKQGNTVIPFQYDELWRDNEGRAAFCQDGKYGYLDAAGDHSVVIPAQFEEASGFYNGLAAVYDGEKAFLIDWDGNPVPGTQDLDPDAYFVARADGGKTTHAPDEYLTICRDGKYGFGHIEYLPALPEESEMDAWAYPEVTAAIEAELVPASMQNLYESNITRGEFCALAVQAIEAVTGQEIADVVKAQTGKELSAFQREYPFLDASGSDVIACYALGILQGRGNGVADPYASITRQEAAAYLARTAKVMGMDVSAEDTLSFADAGSVGEWFTQAVAFVCKSGVMNGTGNNNFTPLGSYTREQSYTTFYRLYNAAK